MSKLTTQHPSQIKMKRATHVDYSFTNEDKQFLNEKEKYGTCVIDNFIGMYGDELKLTRDDFIQLHKDYYGTFEVADHEGNDKWRKTRGASF